MALLHQIEKYDAERGIPRPKDAPHLTPYHAALRCLTTGVSMLGFILSGAASACLLWITASNLSVDFQVRLIFIVAMFIALAVSVMESVQLLLPYHRFKQRL